MEYTIKEINHLQITGTINPTNKTVIGIDELRSPMRERSVRLLQRVTADAPLDMEARGRISTASIARRVIAAAAAAASAIGAAVWWVTQWFQRVKVTELVGDGQLREREQREG